MGHPCRVAPDHLPVGFAPRLEPVAPRHLVGAVPVGVVQRVAAGGRHDGVVHHELEGLQQTPGVDGGDRVDPGGEVGRDRDLQPERGGSRGDRQGRRHRLHGLVDPERRPADHVRVSLALELLGARTQAGVFLDRDVHQPEPARPPLELRPEAGQAEADLSTVRVLDDHVHRGHRAAGGVEPGQGCGELVRAEPIGVERLEGVDESGQGRGREGTTGPLFDGLRLTPGRDLLRSAEAGARRQGERGGEAEHRRSPTSCPAGSARARTGRSRRRRRR